MGHIAFLQSSRRRWIAALGYIAFVTFLFALPHLAPIRASQLVQERQAITFFDRNGLALGTLLTRDQEHTASVPLRQISPYFLQALIAAEDARYYSHGAIDLRSVARALLQLLRHRRIVSGASTIEMQLARMVHPVHASLLGKLYEMWTAARLEAGMDKRQILEAYVNRLPMGGNIYGVEAAARTYFGVPAAELDLAQASLLASLPNDPARLSPYHYWAALKDRQSYVLERMVAQGNITQARADRAFAASVALAPRDRGIRAAPHLLFWMADRLPRGTTRVRTTIDRPLQEFVEEQISQIIGQLASRNVHQAAVLVVDNRSGDVLAYAGSADYFSERFFGRNDGVQALRQPGSALKPFLYEFGLETRAIRPNTILADVPVHYAIPGGLLYSPSDYNGSFQGPVRVRVALADSLNVPAVRVLSTVGVPAFLDRLHALGFAHLTKPPEYYGLGLTLGAGEVSLWELTHAYVTAARGGDAIDLQTVADVAPKKSAALGDATGWALVTNILSDSHARARAFGVGSVLDVPFDAAVKTGTSTDFRDTWTVGYSRDYTVGVWVGNFDGQPMRQISGVTGAAPLWNRIIMHLHEQAEPAPFDAPQRLAVRPICATTGWKPTADCSSVVAEYFYPEDLADYQREPVAIATARDYDEWRADQGLGAARASDFRILVPHRGDLYEVLPADRSSAVATLPQLLEFLASAMRGHPVRWTLNGRTLATTTAGQYFWPLRRGSWTLQATSNGRTDRVTFDVIFHAERSTRRGFSVAGRLPR